MVGEELETTASGGAAEYRAVLARIVSGEGTPDAQARELEALRARIRERMDADGTVRSVLGPLLSEVTAAARQRATLSFQEIPLAGGRYAVGPRPRLKALPEMAAVGVTHVLTLLSDSEGAERVGRVVTDAGMSWLWLPFRSADPPGEERDEQIDAVLRTVFAALRDGGFVYCHCAAGVHRTGMVTFAFLRQTGLSTELARSKLAQLRQITADEVGDHRLRWATDYAARRVKFE